MFNDSAVIQQRHSYAASVLMGRWKRSGFIHARASREAGSLASASREAGSLASAVTARKGRDVTEGWRVATFGNNAFLPGECGSSPKAI